MDDRQSIDEVTRARLAYLSMGELPLGGPRRACEDERSQVPAPAPPMTDTTQSWRRAVLAHLDWKGVTKRHLVAVAVLLALTVVVGSFSIMRSSAVTVPIVESSPSVLPSVALQSPAEKAMIRVHVAGAVKKPGVVSLPEGAIVADAIAAAGGLHDQADPDTLNLAARLTDGTQILIGTTATPAGKIEQSTTSAGKAAEKSRLNLNSATVQELEQLPGIGPVTAAAIVAWREENGRFTAVEDLQQISGIGSKTIAKLTALVEV